MVRPDALPVHALASTATLPPEAVRQLFGQEALRGTERVGLVVRGEEVARIRVHPGDALAVTLDGVDRQSLASEIVRLRGPVGGTSARVQPVRSRLCLPEGLVRAWGVPDTTTVGIGPVALRVTVEPGREARLEVDRAFWLGAGCPSEGRWLPGVAWEPLQPDTPDTRTGPLVIERRVVTETDVRQARLAHRTIALQPGQLTTPAARSLAREWSVFAPPDP